MAIRFVALDENGREVNKETLMQEYRDVNNAREELGKERLKLKEQMDKIDEKMKLKTTRLVNVASILTKFGIHLDIARKNVGKSSSDVTL